MTPASLISILFIYPLVLAGDGCLLIAIALVATTGGNPWLCGAAFAFFHALYSISGLLLTSSVADTSETLGSAIALVGSLILLKHFIHHRLHHVAHGDCSCEHHQVEPLSPLKVISTAAALSLHSLAAGPILRQMSGITSTSSLIAVLTSSALFIGLLISVVIFIGESRRAMIMKVLDALPGIVTGTLTAISCYALFHLVEHALTPPEHFELIFIFLSAVASIGVGSWMHTRSGAPLPQLTTKIGRR